MCGVVGVSLREGSPSDAAALARRALLALSHRGPDGAAVLGDATTAVGMSRLRVRSARDQTVPFVDDATRTAVAFNGEIYSARGRVPTGGLDEALSALRAGLDPDAVDGMYALVASDGDGTLTAARDPLGIKPLYLLETDDGVAFASEIPALLRLPGRHRPRPEAFAQFLLTGRRPVDLGSFLEGLRPVAPGERVTVRNGRITATSIAPPARVHDAPRTGADLRAALRTAVERTLLSDRTLGLAVSGGVDSTILAACLAELGTRDLRTVSLVPDGTADGLDDLSGLGLAGTSGWQHTWTPFGSDDLVTGLTSVVGTLGEPTAMSSGPMYAEIARLARKSDIVVLLVGEGADELFAGYGRYRAIDPSPHLRPADVYVTTPGADTTRALLGAEHAAAAADEVRRALGRAHERAQLRRDRAIRPQDVVREFELEHSMEPLLRRTDHLLMAEGVEGRTPFLHAGVPALAAGLGWDDLVGATQTKVALRAAFGSWLPSPQLSRAKRHFRAPVASWLGGRHLEPVVARLHNGREVLSARLGVRPEGVTEVCDRMRSGQAPAFDTAFMLLSTLEWLNWLPSDDEGLS